MKNFPRQSYGRTHLRLSLFPPLFEDVLDLDPEVMPEHGLEPLELVAAIGRTAARMDHVGPDGAAQRARIARENIRDAELGDRTFALVVHPYGGRIGDELLVCPARQYYAVVFRPLEQLDKQAETLPTHAGLVILLRQPHRGSPDTFWPAATGQIGNREHQLPIVAQAIVKPLRQLDVCVAQSLCAIKGEPCELLPQGEKLRIVRVPEFLDSLARKLRQHAEMNCPPHRIRRQEV